MKTVKMRNAKMKIFQDARAFLLVIDPPGPALFHAKHLNVISSSNVSNRVCSDKKLVSATHSPNIFNMHVPITKAYRPICLVSALEIYTYIFGDMKCNVEKCAHETRKKRRAHNAVVTFSLAITWENATNAKLYLINLNICAWIFRSLKIARPKMHIPLIRLTRCYLN